MITLENSPVDNVHTLDDSFQKVFGRALDTYWSDTSGLDLVRFIEDTVRVGFAQFQLINVLVWCYGTEAVRVVHKLLVSHYTLVGGGAIFNRATDTLRTEVMDILEEAGKL